MNKWLNAEEVREKFPDAVIRSYAKIDSSAKIGIGARIGSYAVIGNKARIENGAVIGKNRKNVTDCTVLHGFNEWGITGFICDDGLIICIVCMNYYKGLRFTDTREEVAKKYPPEHMYFDALNLIEKWYNEKRK